MLNIVPPTDEEYLQTGTGALSGAATGAAIGAAGGPIGALGGALIGGGLAYLQSRQGTKARKKAEKEANALRTASMAREQGIKTQAESMVASSLMRAQTGNTRQPGASTQGFIGQNLPTTAGTF
jgi:phage tail tape-measure protein